MAGLSKNLWAALEFFFYRHELYGEINSNPIDVKQMQRVEMQQHWREVRLNPHETIDQIPLPATYHLVFEGGMTLKELHRLLYGQEAEKRFRFALMARYKGAGGSFYHVVIPDIEAYNIEHKSLMGEVIYKELAYQVSFTRPKWIANVDAFQMVMIEHNTPLTLDEIMK